VPFWLTLVAAALVWLGERVRQRGGWGSALVAADPPRRLLRALVAVVALLLALELWGASRERNLHATGTMLPGQRFLNPDEDIYLEVVPRK
jgi:hypothetical protein